MADISLDKAYLTAIWLETLLYGTNFWAPADAVVLLTYYTKG
jgi:hypothetical protein